MKGSESRSVRCSLVTWVIVGAAVASSGCSSGTHAPAAPSYTLNGTYFAEDVTGDEQGGQGSPVGPYISMTFSTPTSEYAMWKTTCPSGSETPCLETGTFAWNAGHDTLELTSEDGHTTALPASAGSSGRCDAAERIPADNFEFKSRGH